MVVAEFEYWRKVRDVDGAEGWLHKSLIRGRRTAIIVGETRDLYETPGTDAPVVAKAEAGVFAQLLACKGGWCLLETNNLQGWLPRDQFFGALEDEVFD
jgi:SH3-like domain-containing protein